MIPGNEITFNASSGEEAALKDNVLPIDSARYFVLVRLQRTVHESDTADGEIIRFKQRVEESFILIKTILRDYMRQ